MKRVTFEVSEEVHRLIKVQAAHEKISIKDLILRSISKMGIKEKTKK